MTTFYEESAAELAEASAQYEKAKALLEDCRVEYDRTYQEYSRAVLAKQDAQILVKATLAMKEERISKCKAILGVE